MNKIELNIGDHKQTITFDEFGKIVDVNCLCAWGSIHRDQWKASKGLCKHIKEALKTIKNERRI